MAIQSFTKAGAAAALLALSACGPQGPEDLTDAQLAIATVQPVVSSQVPGPAGEILARCVVGNATPNELATLAGSALNGVATATDVTLISEILGRPDTVTCAQDNL